MADMDDVIWIHGRQAHPCAARDLRGAHIGLEVAIPDAYDTGAPEDVHWATVTGIEHRADHTVRISRNGAKLRDQHTLTPDGFVWVSGPGGPATGTVHVPRR